MSGSKQATLSTADFVKGAEDQKDRAAITKPVEPTENAGVGTQERNAPLFASEEANGFRSRWNEIQITFVDEPRHAVEEADGLVANVMKRLAEVFAEERSRLEAEWSRGEQVSTEDLRLALQRYRSFFDRLLSV